MNESQNIIILTNAIIAKSLDQSISLISDYKFKMFGKDESLINFLEKADSDGKNYIAILIDYSFSILNSIQQEITSLEIFKHLRFSFRYKKINLLPILFRIDENITDLIKSDLENSILLSPKTEMINKQYRIEHLINLLNSLKPLDSITHLRTLNTQYLRTTNNINPRSHHDVRNRLGYEYFRNYFNPNENEITIESNYLKSIKLLEENNYEEKFSPKIKDSSNSNLSEIRILYIDDEHRLGWSSGIYTLLTSKNNDELFRSNDELINIENKFIIIDNFECALNFIKSIYVKEKELLEIWSENTRNLDTICTDLNNLRQEYDITNKKNNIILRERSAKVKRQIEIKNTLKTISPALAEKLNLVLEQGIKEFGDDCFNLTPAPGLFSSISELSEIFKEFSDSVNEIQIIDNHFKQLDNNLNQANTELKNLNQSINDLQKSYKELKDIIAETDKTLKDLKKPDIVILDLNLSSHQSQSFQKSDLEGIRLLREIRRKDFNIPIIIFSGYSDLNKYKRAVINNGGDYYWIKAVSPISELREQINFLSNINNELTYIAEGINKVRSLKLLYGFELIDNSLRKVPLKQTEMGIVISLLRESFSIIRFSSFFSNSVFKKFFSFDKVALNMGAIQQIILPVHDNLWKKMIDENKIHPKEKHSYIRKLRNQAAHPYRKSSQNTYQKKVYTQGITYEESKKVLQVTLECLLKYHLTSIN